MWILRGPENRGKVAAIASSDAPAQEQAGLVPMPCRDAVFAKAHMIAGHALNAAPVATDPDDEEEFPD